MELIGQPIRHRTFGSGIVTDLAEGVVTVCFQNSEKKFIFPDAFHDFLVLQDQKVRQCMEQQIRDRERAMRKSRQAEQIRQKESRRLRNFKVTPNSHAVFHLAPEETGRTMAAGQIATGTYLSGYSKGQPRIADRIRPNSVCLLTTCPDGQDEQDRVVTGAWMVREDYFGEDAPDGIVLAHPQHRILLPETAQLRFWHYMGQDSPPRWGNTAFKYCSGDVVNRILADMAEPLCAAGQEDPIREFYRYFCEINRLRPLGALREETPAAR